MDVNATRFTPSRQVGNDQHYLLDMQTTFSSGAVALHACSYLHALRPDPGSELLAPRHADLVRRVPVPRRTTSTAWWHALEGQVGAGCGEPVLRRAPTASCCPAACGRTVRFEDGRTGDFPPQPQWT